MKYSVKTLRDAGLEAKWSRTSSGAPILSARDPNGKYKHQRENWWYVHKGLWDSMQENGILVAFDSYTLLGDVFSIRG